MRSYLEHALHDAGRVELRHQCGDRWASGLFDSLHPLMSAIAGLQSVGNLYATINAPKPMSACNDMTSRPLRDADMGYIVRLPFDFDPVRSAGQPSTDEELALALAQRDRCVQALRALGWPMAATGMSGNGAHALYRLRVPASTEFRDAFRVLFRGMKIDFSTEQVLFDTSVCNPARIWRLYGTSNRKGTPTPERPHRVAQVTIPDRWEAVAPHQIMRLADRYARRAAELERHVRPAPAVRAAPHRPPAKGDFRTLDVRGWFAAHGAYRRHLGAGKHAVLCPWSAEHSTEPTPLDSSTVVWEAEPGLWPSFHCSHAHCSGRSIREVMALWGDADAHCGRAWAREVSA